MINDIRSISIKATISRVFKYLETTPNKFPIFQILETAPFVCIRYAALDGIRAGIKVAFNRKLRNEIRINEKKPLTVGSKLGPIEFIGAKENMSYDFKIDAKFIKCFTGFNILEKEEESILKFYVQCEHPRKRDRLFWIFAKPFHILLAQKVLRIHKRQIEVD